MTLFVYTRNRQYEISDVYVTILTFIITLWVTKIIKQIIQNQNSKNKKVQVYNPKGGGYKTNLEFM